MLFRSATTANALSPEAREIILSARDVTRVTKIEEERKEPAQSQTLVSTNEYAAVLSELSYANSRLDILRQTFTNFSLPYARNPLSAEAAEIIFSSLSTAPTTGMERKISQAAQAQTPPSLAARTITLPNVYAPMSELDMLRQAFPNSFPAYIGRVHTPSVLSPEAVGLILSSTNTTQVIEAEKPVGQVASTQTAISLSSSTAVKIDLYPPMNPLDNLRQAFPSSFPGLLSQVDTNNALPA